MNKSTIITILISFLFYFNGKAEDEKATRVLKKVSTTYNQYKSIKAGFQVTIYNRQSKSSFKQNGFVFIKNKMFRINMDEQEIYCDKNTMYTYLPDQNEVQITNFDFKESELSPSELFTIYNKGFLNKYIDETTDQGRRVHNIELTPINKTKSYFKVKIKIDKISNRVTEAKVYNKGGAITTYRITNFQANLPIKDAFFKFDKRTKPGVVEVDLR